MAIAPSQQWEGIDGSWSTFIAQVGTPAQNVHLLISTSSSATVAVIAEGCQYDSSPSTCPDDRGKIFNPNTSSTWVGNDVYNLGLEENLGYSANGQYGKDTVILGWQGSGGPKLPDQVVAGVASQNFYLGEFGLTPRPTNFTDFVDPQPSYLETLKSKNLIPSLGWSYTAGAKYRLDGVFGSLVLGGYDRAAFRPNNISFDFGQDISRDLTVAIQKATLQDSLRPNFELLPAPIYAFIDSTLPYLYLPQEACTNFEQTFGLQWNSTSQLYFIDDQQHELLLARNPQVTFTLSQDLTSSTAVKIVLPYAAFDLTATYPLVSKPTRYFPLRRAANDTQYTLGRTFLQEAYLTVDYEHSNFSVSQALFNGSGAGQDILPLSLFNIHPSQMNKTSSKKSPPLAATIGGAIGGALLLLFLTSLTCALLIIRRRRQRQHQAQKGDLPKTDTPPYSGKPELDAATDSITHYNIGAAAGLFCGEKSELDGTSSRDNIHLCHPHPHPHHHSLVSPHSRSELSSHTTSSTPLSPPPPFSPSSPYQSSSDGKPLEAQSRPIYEAPGHEHGHGQVVYEMQGSDVAEVEALDLAEGGSGRGRGTQAERLGG
ncbi:MAG: hypothetical protein Q9160_003669 [Pyrenula sp. 1 TL-2023]